MQPIYMILIIAVVLGFFALVYMVPPEEIDYQSEAKQLITRFAENEYIGFDIDPNPPVTTYRYEPKNITKTVTLENGTQINQTDIVYEKIETTKTIETSVIDVQAQGRTTQQSKICKIGYNCDITGKISLADPAGNKLPPPYSYLLIVDCDYRDHCTLSPTPSWNDVTFPDGTFKRTFVVTDPPYIQGQYHATIFVTSNMKDVRDNERTAVLTIEVVP